MQTKAADSCMAYSSRVVCLVPPVELQGVVMKPNSHWFPLFTCLSVAHASRFRATEWYLERRDHTAACNCTESQATCSDHVCAGARQGWQSSSLSSTCSGYTPCHICFVCSAIAIVTAPSALFFLQAFAQHVLAHTRRPALHGLYMRSQASA
jgi:hypothetical protein